MRRRHLAGLAPAAVLLGLWGWAGTPGRAGAGLVITGLLVLACPAAVLSSPGFPACLAPRRRRAAYRYKRARPGSVIPGWMHRVALAAGMYRCAAHRLGGCTGPPQVDHVMPYAAGGLPWFWNLDQLCQRHNMVKSDYWVHRDGWTEYNPWPGYNDQVTAARILAAEKRRRYNPARYLLAVAAIR